MCDLHVCGRETQCVAAIIFGFIVFNMKHTPVSYSDVIELFEIRKKANENKVRSLASLM